MAKYSIIKGCCSKRPLTLSDCKGGDIVSIPEEGIPIGIIISESHMGPHMSIADIENGDIFELPETTACKLYKGSLEFDVNLFENWI